LLPAEALLEVEVTVCVSLNLAPWRSPPPLRATVVVAEPASPVGAAGEASVEAAGVAGDFALSAVVWPPPHAARDGSATASDTDANAKRNSMLPA
jgi:hypothetical protein